MKDKQIIISIGREYGSGGHVVANKLGERLDLKVYDKNIIDDIAREKNPNIASLKEYDKKAEEQASHQESIGLQQFTRGCPRKYRI